jgi:hypothetical protein
MLSDVNVLRKQSLSRRRLMATIGAILGLTAAALAMERAGGSSAGPPGDRTPAAAAGRA